jgi:hypothetical protein
MAGSTKYVRRPDDSGWLRIQVSGSGFGSLCEYTAVKVTREAGGRVYFEVLDGNSDFVGKEASLKKENADKYLSDSGPGGAASVQARYVGEPADENSPFKGKLKQQWAELVFDGQKIQVTLNSVWDEKYTPIAAGTHMIMAPDSSHAIISTEGYRQAIKGLRCTDVWFPIQVAGGTGNSSRYIHAGHLSEGCVTVHELTKWNALYDYLISHRSPKSKGQFVGSLVVRK